MLCGSAFKNKGVQPLLDAVVDFLPVAARHPADRGPRREGRATSSSARPTTTSRSRRWRSRSSRDPYGQAHLLPRLLRQAREGRRGLNATKDKKERIGRLLRMHANHREDNDAVVRRRHRRRRSASRTPPPATRSATAPHPIVLERMEFPEPVISVAIEPKTKIDQDKLGKALGSLSEEDPTFQVHTDDETGQTIIARHGRAAPRRARRPHDARVRGRRQRRQAAGRVPRDHHRSRSRRSRSATSARPAARASTATWSSRSSPPAPAAATSSSTRSPAV